MSLHQTWLGRVIDSFLNKYGQILCCGCFLLVLGPFVDGLQPHDAHQATHAVPSCREPRLGQIRRDLAAAKERILRKYPVNLMHQINRRLHQNL